MMSPSGASTLITSAPRSPRICVASGPKTTVVRSTILIPASGPGRLTIPLLKRSFCRSSTRRPRPQIPVENLRSVPMQHAGIAVDVVVDRFEVFDAVGLAADIGVDRDGHDLGALRPFLVKPLETVDAARREIGRFMVLHEHHRDVV